MNRIETKIIAKGKFALIKQNSLLKLNMIRDFKIYPSNSDLNMLSFSHKPIKIFGQIYIITQNLTMANTEVKVFKP